MVELAATHPVAFGSGAVAALAVLGVGAVAWNTVRTIGAVQREAAELMESVRGRDLAELSTPESYAGLIAQVEELEAQVSVLGRTAAALRPLRWMPGLGVRVSDANSFLGMGKSFAHGTRLVLQGYAPAVYALGPTGSQADLAAIKESLESARPLFAEARQELARARSFRADLRTPETLGARVKSAVAMMDRFTPLVEVAAVVAEDAPQVVGEVVQLRNTVEALRATLRAPAALLEKPEELAVAFSDMQARAREVGKGLLVVKGTLKEEDSQVAQALDTALRMSALLERMSAGLARLATATDAVFALGPLTRESGDLLGQELSQIKSLLVAAQEELEQLDAMLLSEGEQGFGSTLLSVVAESLGSPRFPLQREEDLLVTGVSAVDFLTYFLGYPERRRYLLVGQNDDEIRPTGGFIGVVAEITLEKGELTSLRYLDSTTVDAPPYATNPLPPEPIFRYLWMAKLLFRDGNWNPHFPSTAAQLADLYQRAQAVKTDGVIAVTEEVVLDLVAVFGDIRVPDLALPLDRATASKYVDGDLEYACSARHVSERGKRCFDEDLFQAIMGRLVASMTPDARSGVAQVLLDRLKKKDVLIHVFEPQPGEILWEQDWNGAIKQVDHDYLLVVDTSLPGHARSVVERRVQYQVELAVAQPLAAELLVQYTHRGQEPDPNCRQALAKRFGCYWNYLRVYVPVLAEDMQAPPVPLHEGSEWLIWGYTPADSLTVISSPREGLAGVTEVGAYVPVEPQTSVTLPLRYRLPASVLRSTGAGVFQYRLLVQKQPGTPVEPVTVFVRLPAGAALVRASPAPTARSGDWVRMDVDLAGDTLFVVDFRPS